MPGTSLPFPQPLTASLTGQWRIPTHIASNPTGAGVLTSGALHLMPLDVGPRAQAFQGLGAQVTTAQVAGTTSTLLGIYKDNGSGGLPNLVGGPIYSGSIVLTATGLIKATVAMQLAAGRYWTAWLYSASVAPTTVAQMTVLSGACLPLPFASGAAAFNTLPRYLSATGLTVLPTTQIALTQDTNAVGVVVGIQAT